MIAYTIQMAKHRILQGRDIEFIDTTVKSGKDSPFKPSWEIVLGYKSNVINQAQYTERYISLMRTSYKEHTSIWLSFLNKDKVAIACYCKAGCFCHRLLLIDILTKVAIKHGIEFQYLGELTE